MSTANEYIHEILKIDIQQMLGSNIVKLLEIARNLLEINPLLEIARITKKCSKF